MACVKASRQAALTVGARTIFLNGVPDQRACGSAGGCLIAAARAFP